MVLQMRTDLQNQAIGWRRKGCRSFGGRTVVRFPRLWMSSGECRVNIDRFTESNCQWPWRLAPPSDGLAGFFAAARSRSSGYRARVAAPPRPTGNRPVALTIFHARTVTFDSSRRTKRRPSIRPKRWVYLGRLRGAPMARWFVGCSRHGERCFPCSRRGNAPVGRQRLGSTFQP